VPQTIDAVSFVSELKSPEPKSQNRPLVWHYPNEWGPTGPGIGATSTIRQGDWKLIYYHAAESYELFNLAGDIGETQNLAEAEPDKRAELAQALTLYLQSVDAQMPVHKETGEPVAWP